MVEPFDILLVEHEYVYGPGAFEPTHDNNFIRFHSFRGDTADRLPDPTQFDAVAIFGSVQSVYDRAIKGWFEAEVELLRRALDHEVPVLGVCFGAQALAVALGGNVRRADGAEIGWTKVDTRRPDLVDSGPWFQWHHDVIDVPAGSEIIAENDFCVQAYQHGMNLGVQFHPELTPEILASWLEIDPSEAIDMGLDPKQFMDEALKTATDRRASARRLLGGFVRQAGTALATRT